MLRESYRARLLVRNMLRETPGRAVLVVAGCLLFVFAGCSNKSEDRYIPSESKARPALEAALTAWQEGKQPGPIEGSPIPLQAVDSQWRSGKKLTAFEIIEQEPGDGPPVFSVRLTINGIKEPIVVRYYVVGKEPLWVYREDDYKNQAGKM
jgi:hypothetical protein